MNTSSTQRNTHSQEFKEHALSKAQTRGTRTLNDIASELNLPLGTLKGWLKQSTQTRKREKELAVLPTATAASHWSAEQRLSALLQSHGLSGEALHAWCREKGVFEHQLRQWHHDFSQSGKPNNAGDAALRQAKQKNDHLERQLRRKDKALAEAAALLVLQKKFQALWEDEEK